MRTSPWILRWRRLRSQLHRVRNWLDTRPDANRIVKRTDFTRCEKPVLLIYGFMATRRSFEVMEHRLRRDGYCVFSINLGGLRGLWNNRNVDEAAHYIAEKVERLYAKYSMGPLTIIGHSKGGLIGAYYVKNLGGARRVRTLITLGSPHNGTRLAYLGMLISPLARSVFQMVPISPFIRRLRKTPIPRSVYFASMWSKQDRVCPHPAAVVECDGLPNVHNVEVEAPHHDLLVKKRVYDEVRAQLEAAEAYAKNVRPTVVSLEKRSDAREALEVDGPVGLPV